MKKNKVETQRKIKFNLWFLLALNVGTMVGIGIFFKNQSVLTTAGTGWGQFLHEL